MVGIVFALLIVLCCGGAFYLKSYVASSVSNEPAEVQKIGDEIISIHVPAPLEPVAGGRFHVPIAGTTLGQGVVFSDKNRKDNLVFGSFGDAFGPQFKDQILQALQSGQFQDQSANKNQNHEELKNEEDQEA